MNCCPKPIIFPKNILAPNSSNQSKAMKQSQIIRYNKYTPIPVVNTVGETGPTGPTGPLIIVGGSTGYQGNTGPVGMTGNSIPPVFTNIQRFQPDPLQAGLSYNVPFTMTNFVAGKYIVIFNSQMIFNTTPQSVSTELKVSYNGFSTGGYDNIVVFYANACKSITEHTMNICGYTGAPPTIVIRNTTDSILNLSECFIVFVYLNS